MESDNNLKRAKVLEQSIKRSQENSAILQDIFANVRKGIVEYSKFSRKWGEQQKQGLEKYFYAVQKRILDLDNDAEICIFLHNENKNLKLKIIDANIRGDGFDKKYFQKIVDDIIIPLVQQFESLLEFKKKLPPTKQITIVSNNTEPKILKNKQHLETVSTSNENVVEKTIPESIEPISELPTGFKQIECDATKPEILSYFMILAKEKNNLNEKVYMSEKDVEEFVKKNFAIFNSTTIGIYFSLNLFEKQKVRLRDFIYQFYSKYDKSSTDKRKYVMLLINNFKLFKLDKPDTLSSNMGETKIPIKKNRIPIWKYI